jgi:hypothetical protein
MHPNYILYKISVIDLHIDHLITNTYNRQYFAYSCEFARIYVQLWRQKWSKPQTTNFHIETLFLKIFDKVIRGIPTNFDWIMYSFEAENVEKLNQHI